MSGPTTATIENVNDGTLVTFGGGETIWFDRRAEAAAFGMALMRVASIGGDSLDWSP